MRRRHLRVFRERIIEILPAEIADVAVTAVSHVVRVSRVECVRQLFWEQVRSIGHSEKLFHGD